MSLTEEFQTDWKPRILGNYHKWNREHTKYDMNDKIYVANYSGILERDILMEILGDVSRFAKKPEMLAMIIDAIYIAGHREGANYGNELGEA